MWSLANAAMSRGRAKSRDTNVLDHVRLSPRRHSRSFPLSTGRFRELPKSPEHCKPDRCGSGCILDFPDLPTVPIPNSDQLTSFKPPGLLRAPGVVGEDRARPGEVGAGTSRCLRTHIRSTCLRISVARFLIDANRDTHTLMPILTVLNPGLDP